MTDKRINLLGSTGSIGTQTLDVVRRNLDDTRIDVLAAGSNVSLIEEQIREFRPVLACLYDETAAKDLAVRVKDLPVRVVSGMEGLLEAASYGQGNLTLNAVVGMIGVRPTMAAIAAGHDVALANKESLVAAGHLIMPAAAQKNVQIIPVDSEHSAIFQCEHNEDRKEVKQILLTCSGGTFLGRKADELKNVTAAEALHNPNWDMGAKVTIDSATLVNKGLEVIEASWLFDIDADKIKVLIQPQSLVHSMVEFQDGSVMAHIAVPDMRLPIQYAIYYPQRRELPIGSVDFASIGSIRFMEPDRDTFRGLDLAYRAAKAGGSMPAVFNAANEKAVKRFLQGEIRFPGIYEIIEEAMDSHHVISDPGIDEIEALREEICS
ncbi:MAG: 1-deoxy-D-xylulose-5-phosphate reductoisomerase [Lachnospiraceae bacterium]|nr:1-deoxy-D-xylulose-5-phosphate reductoisomerase [Lachnospiraceae bacterium]